jgi:hypothetical protein
MDKLSWNDLMFGLEEGQIYTLRGCTGRKIRSGVFVKYYEDNHSWLIADFGEWSFDIARTDQINWWSALLTVDGNYFTVGV